MQRTRGCTLIIFLGLVASTRPAVGQQAGTLKLSVQSEGKPVGRAKALLRIGGQRVEFPPTDNAGNSSTSVKVTDIADEYVEVWAEECDSQPAQVYMLARGGKLPSERSGCTRHKTGFFVPRGSGPWQVTTDITLQTVTTAVPVPELPPGTPEEPVYEEQHLWFQGSVGAGTALFPGAKNNCGAIIAIEPGATCTVGDRTFALLANGSINYWLLGAEGGFWRANANKLTSSATLGGVPSTLTATSTPRGFYAAGLVRLPEFHRISIVPKAGVTFWHIDRAQTQTSTSGGTTTTTTSSSTVTGTSPFFGGMVETMITNHIGVGADYFYLRLKDDPLVHEHDHMIFGHVTVRLGKGAPR